MAIRQHNRIQTSLLKGDLELEEESPECIDRDTFTFWRGGQLRSRIPGIRKGHTQDQIRPNGAKTIIQTDDQPLAEAEKKGTLTRHVVSLDEGNDCLE